VEALGAMGGQVGLNRVFKDYSDVLGLDHPPVEDIDHGDPLAPSLVFAMEQDILSYLAGPYAQVASEQGAQPSLVLRKSARRIERRRATSRWRPNYI